MKYQVVKTNKGYVAVSNKEVEKGDMCYVPDTSLFLGFIGKCNLDKIQRQEARNKAGLKFYHIVATDISFKLEGVPQFRIAVNNKIEADQKKGCYTEEDLRQAFQEGMLLPHSKIKNWEDFYKQLIESLKQPKELVAIEVDTVEASQWINNENGHGRINIETPKIIKSGQYPDGLLTVKNYYYE